MIKTYRYRLYPTKKQTEKLEWTLETCRILYNSCLVDRNRYYEKTKKTLSRIDQQKTLVRDKKNIEYLKSIHSQVLQDVLFRVEKAYKAFFSRLKEKKGKAGFPRFKNPGRYKSITYSQSGFEIIDGKLHLSKIGHIKIKQHREITGKIKTCIIKKEIDRWYACFSVEYTPNVKALPNKQVGIDVGIKSFATLSNGEKINNPQYLRKSEKLLVKRQRQLSSKTKGSNNRKKARIAFAKIHKKISNQRMDFHHKVSRNIVDNYGYIKVEDLNIQNMVKNHKLAKSISDAGWGQFVSFLTYKAEEAGCYMEKVNPRNTSKECSICGYIYKDMTLSVRKWTCPVCHTVHDRDVNAAVVTENRETIGKELAEFKPSRVQETALAFEALTLGEISSVDDIVSSNADALKSTLSTNQEAYQFIDR